MAKEIEKYLPVDYSDSFSIEVTENRLSPKDIILKVFAHNPAWLRMLYAIRACLVKPFGIETKAIESDHSAFSSQKSAMLNKHSRGCNYITNMKNEICNIEVHDFRKLMHEE